MIEDVQLIGMEREKDKAVSAGTEGMKTLIIIQINLPHERINRLPSQEDCLEIEKMPKQTQD
jgi:hypothetical protein